MTDTVVAEIGLATATDPSQTPCQLHPTPPVLHDAPPLNTAFGHTPAIFPLQAGLQDHVQTCTGIFSHSASASVADGTIKKQLIWLGCDFSGMTVEESKAHVTDQLNMAELQGTATVEIPSQHSSEQAGSTVILTCSSVEMMKEILSPESPAQVFIKTALTEGGHTDRIIGRPVTILHPGHITHADGPSSKAVWVRASSTSFEGRCAAACIGIVYSAFQTAGKSGDPVLKQLTVDGQFDPLTANKGMTLGWNGDGVAQEENLQWGTLLIHTQDHGFALMLARCSTVDEPNGTYHIPGVPGVPNGITISFMPEFIAPPAKTFQLLLNVSPIVQINRAWDNSDIAIRTCKLFPYSDGTGDSRWRHLLPTEITMAFIGVFRGYQAENKRLARITPGAEPLPLPRFAGNTVREVMAPYHGFRLPPFTATMNLTHKEDVLRVLATGLGFTTARGTYLELVDTHLQPLGRELPAYRRNLQSAEREESAAATKEGFGPVDIDGMSNKANSENGGDWAKAAGKSVNHERKRKHRDQPLARQGPKSPPKIF